jgi:hypothetical protein
VKQEDLDSPPAKLQIEFEFQTRKDSRFQRDMFGEEAHNLGHRLERRETNQLRISI